MAFWTFSKKYLQKHLLLIIVILALSIRLGASLFLTSLDAEPRHDENVFVKIAWNLATGNGFSMNGEIPTARRLPGYPLLLAGLFSIFGKNLVVARLINILASSLTVGLIYLIGARLFNRTVGIIAGLISAFHLVFIEYSLLLYSDTFFLFILSAATLLLIKIHDNPNSLKTILICGVLLGVAATIRAELLILIALIFIWALLSYRQFYTALRTFVIILLPVLLFVMPWLVRNYLIFGEFMNSSELGRTLWGIYNSDTFTNLDLMGGWYPPEIGIRSASDEPRDSQDPAYRYLPEREWDQLQRQLALASIKQNLRELPRMAIHKLDWFIFTPGEVRGAVRDLLRFPLVYGFFFGLVLLLVSGDKRFLILYTLILYALSCALLFYTSERLRMGFESILIVVASYGLVEQIKLMKQRANISDMFRSRML